MGGFKKYLWSGKALLSVTRSRSLKEKTNNFDKMKIIFLTWQNLLEESQMVSGKLVEIVAIGRQHFHLHNMKKLIRMKKKPRKKF
jgi:hypothetical protein